MQSYLAIYVANSVTAPQKYLSCKELEAPVNFLFFPNKV